MRFTLRFLRRAAAARALLTLAPLAVYAQDAPAPETTGVVVANMDRSVKPGDDFYRYANGGWLKRTEIPPDRRYIDPNGLDFDGSNDLTRNRIASLIEEAAKANAPAGSNASKIADFYHSYMDEASIEAKGLAPLHPYLDAIAAIRDKRDLARTLERASGRMSMP
jgi:putative endopeptidase